MSLWSPAARDAFRARITPKPAPRPEVAPKAAPALKPPPAHLRNQDSFTPSGPGRKSPMPELNPRAIHTGYDKPQQAEDLPSKKTGTAILTINTATGAGDEYNSKTNRKAQAELIKDSGATVVAFQEVDVNVKRSGDRNTALDIVAGVDRDFAVFLGEDSPEPVDIYAEAPETAIREGVDGTTLYQTPGGTLVTGEAFSGDDQEGGIKEDRGSDATYGNATYVASPDELTEAYTVALPTRVGGKGAASADELAALADGKLTPEERNQLHDNNEVLRHNDASEPRAALVTRVKGPDGQERTIINVHVAAGEENKELRDAQLAYIAQLAAAEAKGPPARDVVVMGDLNTSTSEVQEIFGQYGLQRAVGGTSGDPDEIEDFDQVWTTAGVNTQNSAQVDTRDTSDHPHAGYTEIS
ncbi:endonuclease/exonuclease/phosphatase family protein [Corallococcus exercitus]|uniref:endonuclease/exonuclease/phosphatase family protein n=1 Tax=Corallococcus exercitus TaxID=2316736 RepID=UPI0035D3F474